MHRRVHPAAERRPGEAVPARDAVRAERPGAGERAAGIERGPAAVVEHRERLDVRIRAATDRRPADALPARDVARGQSAGVREVAARIQRRAAAIVEDRQREHHAVDTAAERGPARAVPFRDVTRGHSAGREERPARVERRPAAVVEDRHGARDVVEAAPDRRPARSVPARDVGRADTARRREVAADIERGPAAIVVHSERVSRSLLEPAPERRPVRPVEARDVVRGQSARGREHAGGVQRRTAAIVIDRERRRRGVQAELAAEGRDPLRLARGRSCRRAGSAHELLRAGRCERRECREEAELREERRAAPRCQGSSNHVCAPGAERANGERGSLVACSGQFTRQPLLVPQHAVRAHAGVR